MYKRYANGLILLILLLIVFLCAAYAVNPLPFKELKLSDLGGTLGALFILVLLVERVLEIIISIWRAPEADRRAQEIASFTEAQKKAKASAFKKLEENLAIYKAETKGISLLSGFSISIIICCAGIGLLSELINYQAVSGFQQSFLRGIDIILTAGLIAGGSDGFHQFVSSLETFFKETKKKLGQNT